MKKVLFKRFIRLPAKLGQTVFYIDDSGKINRGVICDVQIYFINNGRSVDIDYILHPVTEQGETDDALFFSDYNLGYTVFTNRLMARLGERRRRKYGHNTRY